MMLATRTSFIASSRTKFLAFVVTVALIGAVRTSTIFAQHTGGNLPPLTIVVPANGATVIGPVIIVFQTPADLSKMTIGSRAKGTAHIQIELDKRVNMPTIRQLTKVGTDRYQFNLGRAKPGKHTIRLYWADNQRRHLGSTQVVSITVKSEPR